MLFRVVASHSSISCLLLFSLPPDPEKKDKISKQLKGVEEGRDSQAADHQTQQYYQPNQSS